MLEYAHDLLSPYYWAWDIYTYLCLLSVPTVWVFIAALFDGPIKSDRAQGASALDIQRDRTDYRAKLVTLWLAALVAVSIYTVVFGLIERHYHGSQLEPHVLWFSPISWEPEWWFLSTLLAAGVFFALKEVRTIHDQRQFWIDLWKDPFQAKARPSHSDYTYPSEAIVKTLAVMGLGAAIAVYVVLLFLGLLFS